MKKPGFIERILARYRWRYVATVKAYTVVMDDGGSGELYRDHARTVLLERGDGRRRQQHFGDAGHSEYAIAQRAACFAWVHGGPLPEFDVVALPAKSTPPAQLFVFPGGKDGAA